MKLKLKSYQFVLLVSILQFLAFSGPFLKRVWKATNHVYTTTFVLATLSILITNIYFTILFSKITNKCLTIALFTLSAAALYFINSYGILIDRNMLRNVLETNVMEVKELLTVQFAIYIFISVVISIVFVSIIEIKYDSFWQEVRYKIITVLSSLSVVVVITLLTYKSTLTFLRNNNNIQYSSIPINYITAIVNLAVELCNISHTTPITKIDIAPDSKIVSKSDRKNLVILVVGEAARAKNFSLNGYYRDTNVLLTHYVINFTNFSSCGTCTAFSVPCMFSHNDHNNFNLIDIKKYYNLLDILLKSTVNVVWIDNNSGCKEVCSGVPSFFPRSTPDTQSCRGSECYDEIMLKSLSKNIINDRDNLIVLHQQGSHGPAYYLRVPDEFKKFSPGCNTEDFSQCTNEEIVNSYDNTIHYTSYFLNKTIELLETYKNEFNTALLYMSDHGQSLGENGIYLHGFPYLIAPKEQVHIPAIMWLSPEFINDNQIDLKCMNDKKDNNFSHDYLFHTMLKIFNIQTNIYDKNLDLFDGCNTRN